MNTSLSLQLWFSARSSAVRSLLIGLSVGVCAGLVALGMAALGPVVALALLGGAVVAVAALSSVHLALMVALGSLMLLPFGTLPVRIGITPSFLDAALGAFVLVYLIRRMTREHSGFVLTPVHALITLYLMWFIFAFALGMQYGAPTPTVLRRLAAAVLAIGMTFILVDLLRDTRSLTRIVQVIMLGSGAQALIAIVLYLLPDALTENILVRLARFGYPDGGVVRYIESNPALGERAIGTWIDPNALGGFMAVGAALLLPHVFADSRVLKPRWLAGLLCGLCAVALYLSNSRASFLAFAFSLGVLVLIRHRRYIPILLIAASGFLLLPQTQAYIDRIIQAFQGADLATQMRIGEWTDALELIGRFPVAGIGFTGTPYRNVYTDVANMYLIMANQIGLVGVALFLIAMAGLCVYGLQAWRTSRLDPVLEPLHLGLFLALATALINAVADLYYFRLDFQSSITFFWVIIALCITVARLGHQHAKTSGLR
jgi:O-antigen ligase